MTSSWRAILGDRSVAWTVARNTFRLAPDRFLAVFATLAVFVVLIVEILGLPNSRLTSLTQLGLMLLLAPVSLIPTFRFSAGDPELIARIYTQDVPTGQALKLLAGIARRVLAELDNHPKDRFEALDRSRSWLRIIELSKRDLAARFGLNQRVFCDQFFRFSPAIVVDRVTKLGLNERKVGDRGRTDFAQETYEHKIAAQSDRIRSWLGDMDSHLRLIEQSALDMRQVEALFLAESTSGSVQRLAKILESRDLSDQDLRLLFRLVEAYRGRSLFRRLLAVTVLDGEDTRQLSDGNGSSTVKICNPKVVAARVARLLIASGQELPDNQQPSPEALRNWEADVSGYIQNSREPLWDQLKRLVRRIVEDKHFDGRLFIVVESYSRAVRTALRMALPNNKRVQVFFLMDHEESGFGVRLLQHVADTENWENLSPDSVSLSGDLALLKSLVSQGDCCIGLSGAAGILADGSVYSTTPPSVWNDVREVFENLGARTNPCFQRVVLAGSYKVDWDELWPRYKEAVEPTPEELLQATIVDAAKPKKSGATRRQQVYEELERLDIDEGSLLSLRDSLTGGLYVHDVDRLLTDARIESGPKASHS